MAVLESITEETRGDIRRGLGIVRGNGESPMATVFEGLYGLSGAIAVARTTERKYQYVRPDHPTIDYLLLESYGEAHSRELEALGLVQRGVGPIEFPHMIAYAAGARIGEHTDDPYEEHYYRLTHVLRGEANFWAANIGSTTLRAGDTLVLDMGRPILHSVEATTDRSVSIWDIPGHVL